MMPEILNKKFLYAVVGASNNPSKYGHKIVKQLDLAGYKVIPINPNEKKILLHDAFPDIVSAPRCDVVVFVVPPKVVMEILPKVKELGIKMVWLQPGAESDEAINFCRDNDIGCVHHQCIMVESAKQ